MICGIQQQPDSARPEKIPVWPRVLALLIMTVFILCPCFKTVAEGILNLSELSAFGRSQTNSWSPRSSSSSLWFASHSNSGTHEALAEPNDSCESLGLWRQISHPQTEY